MQKSVVLSSRQNRIRANESPLNLKESGEEVKLKDGDVIVTGEVHCRLQSHSLHALLKAVDSPQVLLKGAPLHDASTREPRDRVGSRVTVQACPVAEWIQSSTPHATLVGRK